MKNTFLVSLIMFLGLSIAFAQEPEKDVKKADKLYGLYQLDQVNSAGKLSEAQKIIDAVYMDPAVTTQHKTWMVRGNVYNALSAIENASMQTLQNKYKLKDPLAAWKAYQSFIKAKETAVKGFETKDALKALQETSAYLQSFGYNNFSNGKNENGYENAFNCFEAVLKIDKMLQDNGMKSVFNQADDYQNQLYITALAGMNISNRAASVPYLEELKKRNFNDKNGSGATIYQGLFEYYQSTKKDTKAEEVLAEERTKFPNDNNLLFSEINLFLQKGKLTELIDKLKKAKEIEPNNVSIYNTLGNVYDNLCQKAWEANDAAKANEYMAEAINHYNDALTKEPNNFIAVYSLGALHYNKAAQVGKEVNKLSSDYTAEGTKKYKEKVAEMGAIFDQALPYLEKAEKIDPSDKNTIIALKEIYARKGNFEKSNLYKARLEKM